MFHHKKRMKHISDFLVSVSILVEEIFDKSTLIKLSAEGAYVKGETVSTEVSTPSLYLF